MQVAAVNNEIPILVSGLEALTQIDAGQLFCADGIHPSAVHQGKNNAAQGRHHDEFSRVVLFGMTNDDTSARAGQATACFEKYA